MLWTLHQIDLLTYLLLDDRTGHLMIHSLGARLVPPGVRSGRRRAPAATCRLNANRGRSADGDLPDGYRLVEDPTDSYGIACAPYVDL